MELGSSGSSSAAFQQCCSRCDGLDSGEATGCMVEGSSCLHAALEPLRHPCRLCMLLQQHTLPSKQLRCKTIVTHRCIRSVRQAWQFKGSMRTRGPDPWLATDAHHTGTAAGWKCAVNRGAVHGVYHAVHVVRCPCTCSPAADADWTLRWLFLLTGPLAAIADLAASGLRLPPA